MNFFHFFCCCLVSLFFFLFLPFILSRSIFFFNIRAVILNGYLCAKHRWDDFSRFHFFCRSSERRKNIFIQGLFTEIFLECDFILYFLFFHCGTTISIYMPICLLGWVITATMKTTITTTSNVEDNDNGSNRVIECGTNIRKWCESICASENHWIEHIVYQWQKCGILYTFLSQSARDRERDSDQYRVNSCCADVIDVEYRLSSIRQEFASIFRYCYYNNNLILNFYDQFSGWLFFGS